jgi:glycosyltransferase involved in cell wall biosynthesis
LIGVNLHIYPSRILNESRIFRQTKSVAESSLFSEVVICGLAGAGLPAEERLDECRRIVRLGRPQDERPSSFLSRIKSQVAWAAAVYRRFKGSATTMVNAHSVAVLPVAYLLARRLRAKLIYDTHELETETVASRGPQRVVFKLTEWLLIRKCDEVLVVNDSIADWYRKRYPSVRPLVVRNVPPAARVSPPRDVKAMLGIPAGERLFIHTGNLTAGRNIEPILRAFASAPAGNHVLFLGDGPFAPLVDEFARRHPHIHWLRPVGPDEVVGYVAGCDVALCLIEFSCLSYKLSLPNKALEYIAGGTPFFFTDLPEVANVLGPGFEKWRLKNATDLGAAVSRLTQDEIDDARQRLMDVSLGTWADYARDMTGRYASLLAGRR